MKLYYSVLSTLAILFLFSTSALQGQGRSQVDPAWETGTIENQIDFLIQSSNNYQDYKVIKKASIFQLKSIILDTLNSVGQKLSSSQTKVREQENAINSLNTQQKNLQEELDKTNKEKGSINFMGMQMNKGAYQGLMWTIIAGLLGFLGFFILRFRQSHVITAQARKDLSDMQGEFEDHRKRSLEREQKAMRKLQDVLNKTGGA